MIFSSETNQYSERSNKINIINGSFKEVEIMRITRTENRFKGLVMKAVRVQKGKVKGRKIIN